MKFTMAGQQKGDLSIKVTAWAGFAVIILKAINYWL